MTSDRMKKRIWIVNYYTSSNPGNPRYIEFADNFKAEGYDVLIFNSSVSEGVEVSSGNFLEKEHSGRKFIHVKSPDYVGNGLKRILSIFMFAWRLFIGCKRFPLPDVILFNVHTPFDYPIVWMAKRLKVPFIAEAWDLWPEFFASFGLISKNNPAMKFAYWLEKRLYMLAKQVVFTFEGGIDYLRKKKWTSDLGGPIDISKVNYINSGVNVEEFDKNRALYPRPDEDLQNSDYYKIIYLGSIRLVNNVKTLIDAAAILKSNPKYRFFIYGDGNDREYLEQYIFENQIDNVVFKEKRIPLCEVAWVVSQATVNIMNYEKGFGEYGVSSGKMFQYFAAGRPICCNISLNYSEISRRNLGIDRDLDTPEQYAEALRSLAELPVSEYNEMCCRVRKAAMDFDYKVLSKQELSVINQCIKTATYV